MISALIGLFVTVINLYSLILLVWVVLSWLIAFNVVNRHQPFVARMSDVLDRLTEPVLRPIRRVLPDLGGVDISPIVLLLLLSFIKAAVVNTYYSGIAS